jgi:Natural resistance-associated macrophage protein
MHRSSMVAPGAFSCLEVISSCGMALRPATCAPQVAIAATDLAEIIGSATALYLLFGLPVWAGVLITGVVSRVLETSSGPYSRTTI